MTEIMKWRELGDDFTDSLILGNGASIAVEPRMEYSSLLGEARASGLLTPSVEEVFRRFNTADFEYVLSLLWRATQVNDILGITEETTRNAYEKIRLALARSISKIQPSQSEVRHHLPPIYSFAKQFSTIVSLNYDLMFYWAMLAGNNAHGNWFKDCFIVGLFKEDWGSLREPIGRAKGTTLVFYPHGNLALVTSTDGSEIKIAKEEREGERGLPALARSDGGSMGRRK